MRKFTEEHVTSCLLQTMHAQCQHGECVLWVGVVEHCVHVLLYVSDMHFIFYRSFNIACTCLRAATGKLAAKSSKRHLFLTWNQCCYTRSLTIKKIKLSKRCHTGQHFLAVETVLTYFSCSSVWLVSLGLHLHISMFLTTAFL